MRKLPEGQIDVLFASYGGGHVTMLRPVAQALIREGVSVGFLGLTTAQADLERHGLDYFGFAELEGADSAAVQAWGREFAGPEVSDSPVPYHESVAYHGLNFRDQVALWGATQARTHYATHGRQGFLPVQTMETLLTQLKPRLVVATNSPRAEKALFIAARNLGIPALCLVDLFAIQEVKWIAQPAYASRICVLNQQIADFFVANGCKPETVVITGNPAFDTLSAPHTQAAGRALRTERGFGDDDKVILWASNVEPDRHPFTGTAGDPTLPRRVEAELRDIVATEPGWHLVVRYHPSENVEFVPQANVVQSTRKENLHALVNAVDAVVVIASTVGLEAHLAGKPVVSIDMSVFTNDAPYSRMGISRGVNALDDLRGTLRAALASSGNAIPSGSGVACRAVADQIKSLLSEARYDGTRLHARRTN